MKRAVFASALAVSLLLTTVRLASANCAKDDPTGSKVLAARQEANSTCPCATATDHGTYVKCVAGVANMLSSGANPSLPKSCKGAVKKCAAKSTCGKPGFVTCCIPKGATTICKLKKDAPHCIAKGGTPNNHSPSPCSSCCGACPNPGSGPSCGSPSGAFLDLPLSNF